VGQNGGGSINVSCSPAPDVAWRRSGAFISRPPQLRGAVLLLAMLGGREHGPGAAGHFPYMPICAASAAFVAGNKRRARFLRWSVFRVPAAGTVESCLCSSNYLYGDHSPLTAVS
jgi:hypothetical protein